MRVSDFHFDLPEELIAQHPPEVRGSSRMLVLNRAVPRGESGHLTDDLFAHLPGYLQAGDLLVLNDSRVLPARLFATRGGLATQHNSPAPTGRIEVLLTEQVEGGENVWRVLVKPARKVRPGETLQFHESGRLEPLLTAEVLAAGEFGERTLRFAPVTDFYGRVGRVGHMPLPPYIRREQSGREDSREDLTRYQTVYAQKEKPPGSVAAPTAGLHFTPEILAALEARGVEIAYVTLHVGLGTFQPVRVAQLEDIQLHAERYTLPVATADALNRALAGGRRIIAVGTTTTRTLEHIARQGRIEAHSGETSIFLSPGHRFAMVSGLLTNFHLPESSLLMLAAAFAGAKTPDEPDDGRETILAAYAYAIRRGYRFYSYGDCMLLL